MIKNKQKTINQFKKMQFNKKIIIINKVYNYLILNTHYNKIKLVKLIIIKKKILVKIFNKLIIKIKKIKMSKFKYNIKKILK